MYQNLLNYIYQSARTNITPKANASFDGGIGVTARDESEEIFSHKLINHIACSIYLELTTHPPSPKRCLSTTLICRGVCKAGNAPLLCQQDPEHLRRRP